MAGYLAEHGLPLILDFHNFTGPEYFAGWEPSSVRRAAAAADELALLAPAGAARAGQEPFSERELRRAGCRRTAVVPVLADYGRVTAPARRPGGGGAGPAPGRRRRRHPVRRAGSCPPRRSTSSSRRCGPTAASTTGRPDCISSGGTSSFEYTKALQDFVHDLGLSAAVRLPGEVSDAALAAYFGAADVYLSLSAHEGFGVPLVEAMVAGVPVVTRGAGAVADTVADAALVLAAADPVLHRGRRSTAPAPTSACGPR